MVAGEVDYLTNLQDPDDSRPAKRARLEGALGVTEETQDEMVDNEGWDDIYGDLADSGAAKASAMKEQTAPNAPDVAADGEGGVPLPGYGVAGHGTLAMAPHVEDTPRGAGREVMKDGEEDLPAEAVEEGVDEELVARPQQLMASTDGASIRMAEELTEVAREKEPPVNAGVNAAMGNGDVTPRPASADKLALLTDADPKPIGEAQATPGKPIESQPKPIPDPEFLAAAAAQKDNETAEWLPDSEMESSSLSDSSSDSSSDSDSESDSEGGYEMLDPATAAKILMSGDGDDDGGEGGGKGKGGGDHQPRTANEVKEERIPKPDVQITEDTKVTFLGTVERAVGSMVLVKATTSGEYQVLESGSVLCNERREAIGVTAETLGRVQEPMYSVAFNSNEEVTQYGLDFGAKVFYIDAHSTFVFTQPLKNMKGTDASNIHDEEVGEDELEFSDDEKEAEFKRQRKLAKKSGRGGISRSVFNAGERTYGAPGHNSGSTHVDRPYTNGSDGTQQSYGGGMNYHDEEGGGEEFYQPLKRPDNLADMMSGGGQPRPPQGGFDRGRGHGRGDFRGRGDRGRGRGRGDRGRGRGGFDNRGGRRGFDRNDRGGRGDQGQSNGFRGNAQSYPDSHNNDGPRLQLNGYGRPSHDLPPRPSAPQASSPPPQHCPPQPGQGYGAQYQPPSSYQFNGYQFQHGVQPPLNPQVPPVGHSGYQQPAPTAYQQAPPTPAGSIPAGAFVNPAFFQNQQQSQQAQYGAGHPAWAGQQGAQQQQYGQQPADLADILRRLGGQGH